MYNATYIFTNSNPTPNPTLIIEEKMWRLSQRLRKCIEKNPTLKFLDYRTFGLLNLQFIKLPPFSGDWYQ